MFFEWTLLVSFGLVNKEVWRVVRCTQPTRHSDIAERAIFSDRDTLLAYRFDEPERRWAISVRVCANELRPFVGIAQFKIPVLIGMLI